MCWTRLGLIKNNLHMSDICTISACFTILWILFGFVAYSQQILPTMHKYRGAFCWHSDTFDGVSFEANAKTVGLIWHTKLNSAFFAFLENTLLVNINGELVVRGRSSCSRLYIFGSIPLSINLLCLSHHFDHGGIHFLQSGLQFFSDFKPLKMSHFGFPPLCLISSVFTLASVPKLITVELVKQCK